MARHQAYPVDLVQNLDQAVRPRTPGEFQVRPPVAIDLMIFRALLARPIVEPGEGKGFDGSGPAFEVPAPVAPTPAH